MLTMISPRAFAADTIWTKASAIMQDVYKQILGISTIAAIVTASHTAPPVPVLEAIELVIEIALRQVICCSQTQGDTCNDAG